MQPGQVKVCPQCGQQVPIDSAHCAYCGHAFRTQFFPAPQYGAPQLAYAVNAYRVPKKQTAAKWAIGLLTVGCMAAAIFLVFKAKYPDANSSGGAVASNGTSGASMHAIVPTSILNQQALTSTSKITINWDKTDGGQTIGEVINNSSQTLPNLYLQFLVKNGTGDVWAGPYQIIYQPPGERSNDWIPPNQSISFTVPVEFSNVTRLHAYYVQDSPAGPVQYAVAVDQTQTDK
ncbi:MAG TPA: zinc ribbon domain-containing protein [Fimbriimonadaceae bacterium]|jgi:hypothetical protein